MSPSNAVANCELVPVGVFVTVTAEPPLASVSLIVQASPLRTVAGSAIVADVQTTVPVWFGAGEPVIDAASLPTGVPVIEAVPAGLAPLNTTESVNPAGRVIVTAAPAGVASAPISPPSAEAIVVVLSPVPTSLS